MADRMRDWLADRWVTITDWLSGSWHRTVWVRLMNSFFYLVNQGEVLQILVSGPEWIASQSAVTSSLHFYRSLQDMNPNFSAINHIVPTHCVKHMLNLSFQLKAKTKNLLIVIFDLQKSNAWHTLSYPSLPQLHFLKFIIIKWSLHVNTWVWFIKSIRSAVEDIVFRTIRTSVWRFLLNLVDFSGKPWGNFAKFLTDFHSAMNWSDLQSWLRPRKTCFWTLNQLVNSVSRRQKW